jgi:hypothetical protein
MTRSATATRRATAALLGLGLFAATVAAQQPPRRPPLDPLAEAKARQSIIDQKAEADVASAIADAERLAKSSPTKAVRILKNAQVNVIDLSPTISAKKRESLTDAITRKIAALEGKPVARAADTGVKNDPLGPAVRRDKSTAFEKYAAEMRDVKEGVFRYGRFKDAGQTREADRELARLAAAYPNNPSVIRLQETDSFGDRVDDAAAFSRLQSDRITLAMRSVDKSSLPPMGDIEFPADWKEKTKRRMQKVELTEAEQKIISALDKPITVDWNGRALDEALQEMSNTLDQKLFIDKKAVEDLSIDLRKPVTLQANGVSARTVLRQLLGSQGLTFVIKDQVIQVVDVERARNMLTTRVYYLGDIVQGVGPFGGALQWGPFIDFQQTMSNVETIMKTITSSVDPLSWKDKGGPASITFHFPSMSLIVRASAEVHATLGSKMGGGK